MRVRKITLTTILLVLSIIRTVDLGWTVIADESVRDIATSVLYLGFTLYLLLLSARSVRHSDVYNHWPYIVHLSALCTTALVFTVAITILPSSSPYPFAQNFLWLSTLLLFLAAFAIATRTPRGPLLHYPSSRIYNSRILSGTTNTAEDNVCGVTSASPWSILLFSYTTKVVMLGYTATSLEIGDLPLVPADMRAPVIFARMRRALKTFKLTQWGRWKPKLGSGWQLAYQIIRVNGPGIIAQICLVVVSAGLFYSPAFFLRKLVKYFEDDPLRLDPGWGWVWCAGLFGFNIIQYLGAFFSFLRIQHS